MIVYDNEKKSLVIPNGLGNLTTVIGGGDYEEGYQAGREAQKIIDDSNLTEITLKNNGEFEADYGYKKVTVDVDVETPYNDGYNDGLVKGINDGIAEQKAKLTTINVSANGTYEREDGYKTVNINVPSDPAELQEKYDEGKSDGIAEQKSKLETINVSANGTISREDGYKTVNINVPSDPTELQAKYDEGKEAGIAQQKGKLETLTISNNGTYEKEDGYKKVVVNVSETGKVEDVKSVGLSTTTLEVTPSAGYDAMAKVNINASVLANNKYDEGAAYQKSRLATLTVTSNGTNEREDGYKKVIVNVPSDPEELQEKYNEGKSDGINEQKSKLETITIDANGTYEREDGYKKVVVNTPAQPEIQSKKNVTINSNTQNISPDSGFDAMASVAIDATAFGNTRYNEGVADQKSKLETLTITNNGTYEKEDGYKKIVVDVEKDYQPFYLWIGVTADSHIDELIGKAVVTVSEGEEIIEQIVYTGQAFMELLLEPGKEFTISCSFVSGFNTPQDFTYISRWGGGISTSTRYIYTGKYVTNYLVFSSVGEQRISGDGWADNLEYSYDTVTWNDWDRTEKSFGDDVKICIRGNNRSLDGFKFRFSNDSSPVTVSGNIMCLLDWTNPSTRIERYGAFKGLFEDARALVNAEDLLLPATTLSDNCYDYMFYGCTSLVKAPALPAMTLSYECYKGMFRGCSSLVNTPVLPAMELENNCYQDMFFECTSLVNAPALPATELKVACYSDMFWGCTSLVEAPALPATELADSCYSSMFEGCHSLVNVPSVLPATELADRCYRGMFWGCSKLVNVPELPATELKEECYESMFKYCFALVNAPELPATKLTDGCYKSMFRYCSSLKKVVCKALDFNDSSFEYWLNNVPNVSDSELYKYSSVTIPYVPSNWTQINID